MIQHWSRTIDIHDTFLQHPSQLQAWCTRKLLIGLLSCSIISGRERLSNRAATAGSAYDVGHRKQKYRHG